MSPVTVGVFAALAFVVFVGAVIYTPKLQGSAIKTFGRACLIFLTCISFMLAVALQQNSVNQWYSTWGGVFGQTTSEATDVNTGGSVDAALKAGGGENTIPALKGKEKPTSWPELPSPGSRDQEYKNVQGEKSGLTGTIGVILPEGYDKPGNTETYPVVLALHGAPGSYTGWTKRMHPKEHIDPMVAANKVRPHILVVPRHDFPADQDTECINGPAGKPQVETWLTEDVVNFAVKNFRVDSERTSWATAGYSAGAYCAAMISYRHHETFSAALVMAGYFSPQFIAKPVYPKGSPELDKYNLVKQATSGTVPPVAMWVQAGRESENWKENKAMSEAAKAPLSMTMIEEKGSGHSWTYWESRLGEAFAWLGTNIPGFKPKA